MVATTHTVYLFNTIQSATKIAFASVPHRVSIEGEISATAQSKNEILLLSQTASSSLLTHLQPDARCFTETLSVSYQSIAWYSNRLVLCGKRLVIQQEDHSTTLSLPSEGVCLCGNSTGLLIGCQDGRLYWVQHKQKKLVWRMRSRVKQCCCVDHQFVVCDMKGQCVLLLGSGTFVRIPVNLPSVTSVACCKDFVLVGCEYGVVMVDWDGRICCPLNQERVHFLLYHNPVACFAHEKGVSVQCDRDVSCSIEAISFVFLTNKSINLIFKIFAWFHIIR